MNKELIIAALKKLNTPEAKNEIKNLERSISIVWSIENVKECYNSLKENILEDIKEYPILNDDDCMTILNTIKRQHDCEYGITHLTILYATEDYINDKINNS